MKTTLKLQLIKMKILFALLQFPLVSEEHILCTLLLLISLLIVLAKAQMDEISKGKKTSSGAPSESGVYRLAYSVFDEHYHSQLCYNVYTGSSMDVF